MKQRSSDLESPQLKAKDILDEYASRPTLMERLCSRLRPLRPPVCTSKRFFDYFELPDPYHPIDYAREYRPEIGSSVLILGENRRPVAPHATVPPLKPRIESEKPKAPQAFKPQGVPSAPTRNATPKPPAPPPPKKSSGEFGSKSQHAVQKLPVRPDLAQQSGEAANQKGNKDTGAPINRSIPRPTRPTSQSRTGNVRMRRSTITNAEPKVTPLSTASQTPSQSIVDAAPSPQPTAAINRSPSAATGDGGLDDLFGFGGSEGRMKMPRRSVQRTQSPTVTPTAAPASQPVVTPPTPVPEKTEPVAQPPVSTTPVNRSPSAAAGGGGLDDLFGFGSPEGRMKIPRRQKTNSASSDTSGEGKQVFDRNPVQPPDPSKK